MKTNHTPPRLIITLALMVFLAVLVSCGNQSGSADFTSPQELIEALEEADLEVVDPQSMTKDDYGLSPYVATGVHFLIPSLCEDCGGRAFVGAPDEIEALRDYYDSLGEASAVLFSWTFVSPDGRALIQLNGDLSEEQATKYRAAIEGS